MISICLRSSSNIVSGLGKGVGDVEGVYHDVFFHLIDGEQNVFFVFEENYNYFNPQAQQI